MVPPPALKPGPRPIGRLGLTNQTYEALKEQILDQTIAPGARLNIDQLVAELGVSSTPIREALARLLTERLVTFAPYIGYSASPIHDDAWFHDMIDFRVMLEGEAARLGAPRRDREILVEMQEALHEMETSGLGHHYRKYARFNAADARFHRAVIRSSGNRAFEQVYADLQPHVHHARHYLNRGVEKESLVAGEHHAVLEAFRDGDGAAARTAIAAHLEAARARLLAGAAAARAQFGAVQRPKKR